MTASVKVHAVFSVSVPTPLFIVAAEVLDGHVEPGMYVHLPFNDNVTFTVRILSTSVVPNTSAIPLLGLCLYCAGGNTGREMNESLIACNDIIHVDNTGND